MLAPGTVFIMTLYISLLGVGVSNKEEISDDLRYTRDDTQLPCYDTNMVAAFLCSMVAAFFRTAVKNNDKNVCEPECIVRSNKHAGRFLSKEILGNCKW